MASAPERPPGLRVRLVEVLATLEKYPLRGAVIGGRSGGCGHRSTLRLARSESFPAPASSGRTVRTRFTSGGMSHIVLTERKAATIVMGERSVLFPNKVLSSEGDLVVHRWAVQPEAVEVGTPNGGTSAPAAADDPTAAPPRPAGRTTASQVPTRAWR
jgi:hypothetical protein